MASNQKNLKNRIFEITQINRMGFPIKSWTVPNFRFLEKGEIVYFVDPKTTDGIFFNTVNVFITEKTVQNAKKKK